MYKKDRYIITCLHCGGEHKVGDNRIKYCSIACYNTATKTKGVDGYRDCKNCSEKIPYRFSNKNSMKTRFCSKACSLSYRNRHNNPAQTPEGRVKIAEKARQRSTAHLHTPEVRAKQRASISGDKHWNWQGGKTDEQKRRRNSYETKQWRKTVFERDDFTCQLCNTKGGYLEADHIKPWSTHPDLRYDLDNGRTLCRECHRQTDTYGVTAKKVA